MARNWGTTFNADGDAVPRDFPMDWVDALPAAGEFPGHLFYLTTGSVGVYVWDGSTFVGPFGTGGGGGTGDVVGPAGATDNAVARFNLATGKLIQNSLVIVSDAGSITLPALQTVDGRDLSVDGTKLDGIASGANNYVHPNHSGDVTSAGDGAQTIAADAVTYAKMQNVSAASRLLGRGSAAGAGDPQEITLGTNLSMSGTTLNASGSGTTPTGTGFRHVTAGVEDAAAKLVDTADVNNSQVTNAKLADMAAETIKGRASGAGTGAPTDLVAADLETILGISTTPNGSAIPKTPTGATSRLTPAWIAASGGPALLCSDPGSTQAGWRGASLYPAYAIVKSSSNNFQFPKFSGTTPFPTSPADGQHYTRTDLGDELFIYSSARSGWLSVRATKIDFQWPSDITTGTYTRWAPTTTLFSSTFGPVFGYDVKITGMGVYMATSGTGTAQVGAAGSAVTGSDLALAGVASLVSQTLNSNVVTAGQPLGVFCASGTLEGAGSGYFEVRRFEV